MIYDRLGQLDYGHPHNTDDITEVIRISEAGEKFIYVGQTKDEVRTLDGIGIIVWKNGGTHRF